MLRGDDDNEPNSPSGLMDRFSPTFASNKKAPAHANTIQQTSPNHNAGNNGHNNVILFAGSLVSNPNPAAQPTWFLAKDPDPMMQALLENMLAIESSLLELRMKARLFQDSVGFLCRTMTDQANCFARLCKDDIALGHSTEIYATMVHQNLQSNAFAKLCESLELKVYEPINVNLLVLSEIKARAHERETLRKKSKGRPTSSSSAFADMTAHLFEELAALQKHRYDFVRGLHEGLKSTQRRFFTEVSGALSTEGLDVTVPKQLPDLPKSPSHGPSLRNATKPVISPSSGVSASATQPPGKEEVILIAKPLGTKFDPSADQVNASSAPAFSRFNRDTAPQSEAPVVVSKPVELAPVKGTQPTKSSTVQAERKPTFDEDDDSDFDTV
jgi:hypothetical protein